MWQKLYQHLQQEAPLSGWKTSVFTVRNVNHLVLLILTITYCTVCQQAAASWLYQDLIYSDKEGARSRV